LISYILYAHIALFKSYYGTLIFSPYRFDFFKKINKKYKTFSKVVNERGTRFLRIFNWYDLITWSHILYMHMWLSCLTATKVPSWYLTLIMRGEHVFWGSLIGMISLLDLITWSHILYMYMWFALFESYYDT